MFNYTADIEVQILTTEKEVKQFLIEELNGYTKVKSILNAIYESLYNHQAHERMEIILHHI